MSPVDEPRTRRERLRATLPTLAVALLSGAAGLAGSFAVAGFTPDFVAGPIAGFVARWLPGEIITFGILVLGDLGNQLNLLTALGLAVGLLAAGALGGLVAGRRLEAAQLGAVLGGWLCAVIAFAVTGAVLVSVAAGFGAGIVLVVAAVAPDLDVDVDPERRRVLGSAASALAVVAGGYLLGSRGGAGGQTMNVDTELDVAPSTAAEIDDLLAEASGKSLGVDGLEPLVSDEFYEVDINATDPALDAEEWTLTVTGAVDEEVTYTHEEITAMAAENRFVSLRCVGEQLNGRKMDNALWTGVPIMDLVAPAGPAEECCVMLRAADDYYEEFPLPALEDGFLAYGMNGAALPRGHGHPVRALIPGHWGEINVKWLTEIEVLEEEQDGYWEQKGWHGTGPVNTVAKIHAVNELEDGRMQVGGHAYAGTRGIQQVEVSTDGGDSWTDARLSEPLPGDDVWRQWVHEYDPPGGEHEVVARATDGTGDRQPREETSPFPSGPSGWVSRTVNQ